MDKDNLGPDTIVDFIGDIFARRGAEEYLGEPLTLSQHMLQCANCAVQAGEDDELIAAALLHDIGHFTNEFPMMLPIRALTRCMKRPARGFWSGSFRR